MTDEEIVKLVQNGETEKYGLIIQNYQRKLYGYLRNLTNQSPEEIEDLTEEVLISAYQNLQSFETSKKFSSWIFRIAHNKAVDFFKKKKINTSDNNEYEEWLTGGEKLLEEIEIEEEQKNILMRCVENLELKYKEVILLYFIENKTYDEISDILKIPVNNVGVLLFRAKDKLKKLYEKQN